MKTHYRILLNIFLLVVLGFLLYSTWVQWQGNQKTRIERMKPITPTKVFRNGVPINEIAFSPTDSKMIATARKGNKAKIWNIGSKENPIQTFAFESDNQLDRMGYVDCLAFSKSGEWLLNKTYTTLVLWHVSTGKEISINTIRSFTAAVSPYKDILAINDMGIRLWDYSNPKKIKLLYVLPPKIGGKSLTHEEAELVSHHNAVINQKCHNIAFSNDGKWLAATVRLPDYANEYFIFTLRVWDLQNKKLVRIYDRPNERDLHSMRIRFSPDNRFIAVTGRTGITIWSLPDWTIYRDITDKEINDIAFSSDGKLYAIAKRGQITLFRHNNDIPIGILRDIDFLAADYNLIVFSPNGKTIASGGYDGNLRVWDLDDID